MLDEENVMIVKYSSSMWIYLKVNLNHNASGIDTWRSREF